MKNLNIKAKVIDVYSRNLVRDRLIGKSCYNCTNPTCSVSPCEYEDAPECSCYGWENSKLVDVAISTQIYDISQVVNCKNKVKSL